MDDVINPLFLYLGCGLGAVGVMLAAPRRGSNFTLFGGLIAAIAGGLVLLGLFLTAAPASQIPNLHFYGFSFLALAGAVRMITHPRPVYAALYFILTILASAGLYLLLSAEFMAFALIIIYAGAILITYLFVIMLATQAPSEEEKERLSEYDAVAREPVLAASIGFSILALLSTIMFNGVGDLPAAAKPMGSTEILSQLPGKVEDALLDTLLENELINEGETIARMDAEGLAGPVQIEPPAGDAPATIMVSRTDEGGEELMRAVSVPAELWPADLSGTNVEGLGLNLIGEHPMTIEIAGVILLMAMLGAVVLARKQVDLEDEAKRLQARKLHLDGTIDAGLKGGS